MESENKYLKQIRDELKKKNGSTGHSLYNDPNSKAKYLRDIAKEIHKYNGGGGGSDNTVIVNVTNYDDSGDVKYVTLDKSYRQIEQLLLDGKDVKIYFDVTPYFDRWNVNLLIFGPVLFLHDSITALRFLSQPFINEQESGTTLQNIYVREIRQHMSDSSDTNQFIFETTKYVPNAYVDAMKDNNDGWYKIPDFDFTELQDLCDEGQVVAIRAWESDKRHYEFYYLDTWTPGINSLIFTRTTPTGAKHLTYATGINGQYTEETLNTARVLVVDSNTSVLRVPYSTLNELVSSGNVVMLKLGSTSYNFDRQNGTVFTFSNTSINTVDQTTIQIIKKKAEVPYNTSGDPEAAVSPSTETITCTMDNVSAVVS